MSGGPTQRNHSTKFPLLFNLDNVANKHTKWNQSWVCSTKRLECLIYWREFLYSIVSVDNGLLQKKSRLRVFWSTWITSGCETFNYLWKAFLHPSINNVYFLMEIGVHITCTGRNFRLSLKSHITTVHIKDFTIPERLSFTMYWSQKDGIFKHA